MSKLLLTSNGFFTEQIKKQFLQLIDKEISNLKVSIITTASLLKENNQYARKAKKKTLYKWDFIRLILRILNMMIRKLLENTMLFIFAEEIHFICYII